jgi:hypothetical protein
MFWKIVGMGIVSFLFDSLIVWYYILPDAVEVLSVPFLIKFVLIGVFTFKALFLLAAFDDEVPYELQFVRYRHRPLWCKVTMFLIFIEWLVIMVIIILNLNNWVQW